MKKKGQSHEKAGINKKPSESVYSGDILADSQFLACNGLARGAWLQSLLPIWRDKVSSITGDVSSFARLWGMTEEESEYCIKQFILHKPCDVLLIDCDTSQEVTTCHNIKGCIVTLTNRRKARAEKSRIDARKRKQEERERKKSQEEGDNVTGNPPPPSSSFSSSSSPSVSKETGGSKPAPRIFIKELEIQLKATEALITACDSKTQNEETKSERKVLRERRKDLLNKISTYTTKDTEDENKD